jgi:hypothetical protein
VRCPLDPTQCVSLFKSNLVIPLHSTYINDDDVCGRSTFSCSYVPENEVERHVKVCPALFHLEANSKPYYRKGMNSFATRKSKGKGEEGEEDPITSEELESLASRVDGMYESFFRETTPSSDEKLRDVLPAMDKDHFEILRLPSERGPLFDGRSWRSGMDAFDSVWESVDEMGKKRKKHGIQGMAICECLHLLDLVRDEDQLCVEFGAGRAGLSSILSRTGLGTSFALIERENSKKKYDMEIREGSVWIERVRLDIEDVSLPSLIEMSGQHEVLGVGKHLCGGGTDVCLKCMCFGQTDADGNEPSPPLPSPSSTFPGVQISGVVVALCCHHKMDFGSYILDEKDLGSLLGITVREFNILCKLTSWYTCDMESKEREHIGWMSKRLIDIGRMAYLRSKGFENVFLMEYVPPDVSKENVLLVALNKK